LVSTCACVASGADTDEGDLIDGFAATVFMTPFSMR
jgi:hypothetical protein